MIDSTWIHLKSCLKPNLSDLGTSSPIVENETVSNNFKNSLL